MAAAAPIGSDTATDPPKKPTIVLLLWATTTTLFWTIFAEPQKTFGGRLVLLQPLWILRIFVGDAAWPKDLALFLSLHGLRALWTGAWHFNPMQNFLRFDSSSQALWIYLQVFALLAGCGIMAGMIVYRGQRLNAKAPGARFIKHRIEESLLPPLLIPSRTSHSRMFPRKHAFSYSYLFVGIPVGSQGRIGNVLSIDCQHPAWFDIRSKDYLIRGNDHLGIGEKLQRYLHIQGITDRDYAFAYLVTAPRVFGYSFNPVSFWYLYDSDTRLKYMVLEVNNTFDERRMYLLHSDSAKTGIDDDRNSIQKSSKLVFTDSWAKDFHVSPFNSRKGSYSIKAIDPLAVFQETGDLRIDNTIVLRSSHDSPKVIARACSEGTPRNPSEVGAFELVKFLAAWWWVGLLTLPRILWEAQKLFFYRKLHVWYRPEVSEEGLGREYTDDERALEGFFRQFLAEAVEKAKSPLRVVYEPAHNESAEIVLYSPGFTYGEDHEHTITLKVLTPAFYSRFVHYAHTKEALDRECLATDEKSRTLSISGTFVLPALLHALGDTSLPHIKKQRPMSWPDRIRWSLVRRLRCLPTASSYSSNTSQPSSEFPVQGIRFFPHSELDRFVQTVHTNAHVYRHIAIKLFIAERAFFGSPVLLSLCNWILKGALILLPMIIADKWNAFDILRPRSFLHADSVRTGVLLVIANSVHFWSFFKA